MKEALLAVEARLAEVFASAAGPVRNGSAAVARALGLGRMSERGWSGQFSPLTILYPMLQAENLPGFPFERALELTVAHLLLLIHAFLEDRQLDRQIEATALDILFSKFALIKGLAILSELAPSGAFVQHPALDRLLREYTEAQLTRYAESDADPNSLAAGRAALGAISLVGLGLCAGADSDRVETMLNAYRSLTAALQWADDLDDWPEDFLAGRENLLLHTLGQVDPAAAEIERTPGCVPMIERRMLSQGVHARALRAAAALFAQAESRQRGMGCEALSALIRDKIALLEAVKRRIAESAVRSFLKAIPALSAGSGTGC